MSEELLTEAQTFKGEPLARMLLGDVVYRSRRLKGSLAECGILLVTERQSSEGLGSRGRALASLERVFRLGETLATSLTGLVTRIAAKMTAYYTYAFVVNRLLGRPQGRIKELWA